jgi:hypothetical protein
MTYVAPYSQATLIFEPDEEVNVGRVSIATPGTILDYVTRYHRSFLDLIKRANLMSLYNTINNLNYTVFIPRSGEIKNTPKAYTVPGIVTICMMLTSPNMIIYSMSNDELRVTSINGNIFINGSQIIYGDIECTNGLAHVVNNS